MDPSAMDQRRQQLLGWIEQTKRNQRKLAVVSAVLAVIAIGISAWNGTVGTFAFIGVGLFAICAFWVTAAHNAAHYQK
jgi:hypothetical protein